MFGLLLTAFLTRDCLEELKTKFEELKTNQSKEYEIRPGDESQLLVGTNKDQAFLVLHGFLASPWEVETLSKALNEKGYTVASPLVSGWGSDAKTANKSTYKDWLKSAQVPLELLKSCYPKIGIAGFSMGAAIATILLSEDEKAPNWLSNLTLLSPALRLHPSLQKMTELSAAGRILPSIPLSVLQQPGELLGDSHDLDVPLQFREHYTQDMPLKSLITAELLIRRDYLIRPKLKFLEKIPVSVIWSDYEKTIDGKVSVEYFKKLSKKVKVCRISAEHETRHQILVNYRNTQFEKILQISLDASLRDGSKEAASEDVKSWEFCPFEPK